MVEINFMEMYCQPAKNIFEATIFHCKKYFKRVKGGMIDIQSRTLHSGNDKAGGTSWGNDKANSPDAPWRGSIPFCSHSKMNFKTEI